MRSSLDQWAERIGVMRMQIGDLAAATVGPVASKLRDVLDNLDAAAELLDAVYRHVTRDERLPSPAPEAAAEPLAPPPDPTPAGPPPPRPRRKDQRKGPRPGHRLMLHKNRQWFAAYRINGRQRFFYFGKDWEQAERAFRAWENQWFGHAPVADSAT